MLALLTDIEIWATLFGLASVVLTVRQNIWCWPTGLVMVTLYIFIFRDARLYSDMGLQVVYVFLQIYGWWYWLHPKEGQAELPVTRLGRGDWLAWITVAVIGTAGLGAGMAHATDADLPFWDAATTVLSLIAQWLMAKKRLGSWLFWITVDVLAVGIYYVKGLHATTVLYAAFLVLATAGYFAWRRSYRELAHA